MLKVNTEKQWPDFIGIGGARCGSSWLYENLKQHPGIWLPPIKELHYFDRSFEHPSPNRLAEKKPVKRLLSQSEHNKVFRIILRKEFAHSILSFNRNRFFWNLRYFLGRYCDEWYASLFNQGRGKVKGEVTPAYSVLKPQDVAHIYKIMPHAKIIFLIRNPIQRAWSSIRKNQLSSLSHEEVKHFLEGRSMVLRSDYLRTIAVWQEHFPKEQFFIGFFDEIQENPEALLIRIFKFLGVEVNEQYVRNSARKKFNPSSGMTLPDEMGAHLARIYHPGLKELNAVVGGCTSDWLLEAESLLKGTGESSVLVS